MEFHNEEHEVLIVPGLVDGTAWLEWMTKSWRQKYGLGAERRFQPKLDKVAKA